MTPEIDTLRLKYPYFPFYVDDFLSSAKVLMMSPAARGCYIMLLCRAWHEDPPASLPNDDAVLAAYSGTALADWLSVKPAVLACFTLRNERLFNVRLQIEHDRLERKKAGASKAGRESGKSRRSSKFGNERSFNERSTNVERSGSGSGYGSVAPFRREEFDAAAKNLGCTETVRDHCWAFYESQGWHKSNGRPISGDPRALLTTWMASPQRVEATGNGKRQAWQVEADLKAAKAQMNKLSVGLPFGTTPEAEAAREKWRKGSDGQEYTKLKARVKELETELRGAI